MLAFTVFLHLIFYETQSRHVRHKFPLRATYSRQVLPRARTAEAVPRRVWKYLRYCVTHNVYFDNLETLENAVIQYLKEHAQPNKQLASLCCNNSCV